MSASAKLKALASATAAKAKPPVIVAAQKQDLQWV